jgi:hypothetical protein
MIVRDLERAELAASLPVPALWSGCGLGQLALRKVPLQQFVVVLWLVDLRPHFFESFDDRGWRPIGESGSSPYNSNTFPAGNSWYSFKPIQNNAVNLRVMYDGRYGGICDVTAGEPGPPGAPGHGSKTTARANFYRRDADEVRTNCIGLSKGRGVRASAMGRARQVEFWARFLAAAEVPKWHGRGNFLVEPPIESDGHSAAVREGFLLWGEPGRLGVWGLYVRFQNGTGKGNFWIEQGSNRMDIRRRSEKASCCGVNLAVTEPGVVGLVAGVEGFGEVAGSAV